MTTTIRTTIDLGRIFPKGCSIMAKKELQYTPLLGQFMTLSNAVFVNRSRRADAVAVFAKVATTMKEKIVSPPPRSPFTPRARRSASLIRRRVRCSCRSSSSPKEQDQLPLRLLFSRSKKARSISLSRRNFLSSPSSARITRLRTLPRIELSTEAISSFKVRLSFSPACLSSLPLIASCRPPASCPREYRLTKHERNSPRTNPNNRNHLLLRRHHRSRRKNPRSNARRPRGIGP